MARPPRLAFPWFALPAGMYARPAAAASNDDTVSQTDPKAEVIEPWFLRHTPSKGLLEVGLFGGVFLLNERIELYEVDFDLPLEGFHAFERPAPHGGLRFGYYVWPALGVEAEAGYIALQSDVGRAHGYNFGGHLIAQLPRWSVTPFLVAGMSGVGVASPRSVVGNDVDEMPYFGGGLKWFLARHVMFRVDIRDVLSRRYVEIDRPLASNLQATIGLSVTLGRPKPSPAPPSDRDGDGYLDAQDACPNEPGVAPDGCPTRDRDGDGIPDPNDACPDEAGPAPSGCPPRDQDGDGIVDDVDRCPTQPETVNGFQDSDGCPDEVPVEVQAFTGVIEEIYFELGRATIQQTSEAILGKAVEILNTYPDLRVEISGHTDSSGTEIRNDQLGHARASSVKQWLEAHGIDGRRLETASRGASVPIDTNRTAAGRAKNRRIEFRLI
ncbi:MAG: OmpA family protein [Nannocystaceae bacterium]